MGCRIKVVFRPEIGEIDSVEYTSNIIPRVGDIMSMEEYPRVDVLQVTQVINKDYHGKYRLDFIKVMCGV